MLIASRALFNSLGYRMHITCYRVIGTLLRARYAAFRIVRVCRDFFFRLRVGSTLIISELQQLAVAAKFLFLRVLGQI